MLNPCFFFIHIFHEGRQRILIPNRGPPGQKCKSVCFLSLSHPSSVFFSFPAGIFLGSYHKYFATETPSLWLACLEPRFPPSSFHHFLRALGRVWCPFHSDSPWVGLFLIICFIYLVLPDTALQLIWIPFWLVQITREIRKTLIKEV